MNGRYFEVGELARKRRRTDVGMNEEVPLEFDGEA